MLDTQRLFWDTAIIGIKLLLNDFRSKILSSYFYISKLSKQWNSKQIQINYNTLIYSINLSSCQVYILEDTEVFISYRILTSIQTDSYPCQNIHIHSAAVTQSSWLFNLDKVKGNLILNPGACTLQPSHGIYFAGGLMTVRRIQWVLSSCHLHVLTQPVTQLIWF